MKAGFAVTGAAALALAWSSASTEAASLTILHNNDGESALLPFDDPADHGGIARAVTAVDQLRALALDDGRDVLVLSSGDNFLAGLAREAGARDGIDYDARGLARIGYDAIALGNHDFDFGPEALADFIGYAEDGRALFADTPFLAANLDLAGEPALAALAEAGRIVAGTVVTRGDEAYGVIGGITERLPQISSPGAVSVTDFATAVRAEVDRLAAAGVTKTILISHLQGLGRDVELLRREGLGVDIVIAGGGGGLIADHRKLDPATGEDVFGNAPLAVPAGAEPARAAPPDTYPLRVVEPDGRVVRVVTTTGNYQYWGRLNVDFDEAGEVTAASGDPVTVAPAFAEDPQAVARIAAPVAATVDAIAAEVVGVSEVTLANGRAPGKRVEEVNLGNLVADAFVWQAKRLLGDALAGKHVVGLQNGGGIRGGDTDLPAGEISRADTLDLLPFPNALAWTDALDAGDLVAVLEHGVSAVEDADGRFLQVSGLRFTYEPSAAPGERVQVVRLADGTVIFDRGAGGLQPAAADVDLAVVTNSFTAAGGDGFARLADAPFADLGATYEQPLVSYIEEALDGRITAEAYPAGGEGRIRVTGAGG
ncbi:MAG: bifunctional metallophosphatase/5'-nucleotidase [Alphaproteobacteria bacterium]|jgi:5'-nucleotidase|nr:bifunctional metallophosphatase/5'-nucleotidase [Alphaproteobacteria bacterium]